MSAHDNYLDPDRHSDGAQAYRLPVEIPDSLNYIEGIYWDEDGWVMLNLNPTPTNTEYLTDRIGGADEEDEAIKVAQDYLRRHDMFPMPTFKGGGDGAHCGLTDWYDEHEEELIAALASGKAFDTGWYCSKKEIASARISSDGETVRVEVSVSDDFDTEGYGHTSCSPRLESIEQAIYDAWASAEKAQRENRQYVAYSLIKWSTEIHFRNEGDNRKRYAKKRPQCVDYLILPAYESFWEGCGPPGDNYYFWGWQNDHDHENDEDCGHNCVEKGISKRTAARLREFAEDQNLGSLRIGDWEIRSWDEEEA